MEHAYLISILNYDQETGEFTWIYNTDKSTIWNSKYPGRRAGTIFESQHGMLYWRIKIDGKSYLAHRLAWFYINGEWPQNQIDHWDGDGLNNIFINLRDGTQSENMANRGSPEKGVDYFPNGKWRAKITVDYKQMHLGMFDTKEEALAAHKKASQDVYGDFSIYNRRE